MGMEWRRMKYGRGERSFSLTLAHFNGGINTKGNHQSETVKIELSIVNTENHFEGRLTIGDFFLFKEFNIFLSSAVGNWES
jgi:hypothetical protein